MQASALLRRAWAALRMHPRRQALLAEAAAAMLAARLLLLVMPFRRIAARYGQLVSPADPDVLRPMASSTRAQTRIARKVRWAVATVAPHLPFRSACLQQAMAAQAMLRRRGVGTALHFGARRTEPSPMEGHAWLDAAGVQVTGYPLAPDLVELGCFVCPSGD